MNPLVIALLKWAVPVLVPVIVAAIKQYASGAWEKIPPALRPLIAAILGALAGIGTGEVTMTGTIATNAAIGAALGSLSRDVRDSYREVRPAGVE